MIGPLRVSCCLVLTATFATPPRSSGEAPEDKARDIIRKAEKAHGGKKNLARLLTYYARVEGNMEQAGKKWEFKVETWNHGPDRTAKVMKHKWDGMWVPDVRVVDRGKGWLIRGDEKRE